MISAFFVFVFQRNVNREFFNTYKAFQGR